MSVKEMLYERIQDLTEEEARSVLDFVSSVKRPEPHGTLWQRLARIPGIKLPEDGFKPFPPVTPIQVGGIPASQLLIEDRR